MDFRNKKNKDSYKWICYLSATSVYGNHYGAWVDEKSITSPTSTNGKERLNAEKNWLDLALSNNLPFQIFLDVKILVLPNDSLVSCRQTW